MKKIRKVIYSFRSILLNDYIRNFVSIIRCFFYLKVLGRKIETLHSPTEHVSQNTIFSNKRRVLQDNSKHPHPSARYFLGIDLDQGATKSNLLINPIKSVMKINTRISEAKVLTIGPRTEGEILNLVGHGFARKNISALDLFSYSPWIKVGDMHDMPFDDNSFDVVILGWVLAYSNDKRKAAAEIMRVAKPGAVVGIGVSYSPRSNEEIIENRGYLIGSEERITSTSDIHSYFDGKVESIFFQHDISKNEQKNYGQIMSIFSVK